MARSSDRDLLAPVIELSLLRRAKALSEPSLNDPDPQDVSPAGLGPHRGGEPPEGAGDERLVAAVANGDRRAASALYDRLAGTVAATLYRILGPSGEKEDLVQTAFEQIVFTLATRRYAGMCSLTSWSVAVTSRVAFNALRARVRARQRFVGDLDVGACRADTDVETEVHVRQQLGQLRDHLARMKPVAATILYLYDGMGYSLPEIAEQLGMSVAAAQSQLVRARKKLRSELERPTGGTS